MKNAHGVRLVNRTEQRELRSEGILAKPSDKTPQTFLYDKKYIIILPCRDDRKVLRARTVDFVGLKMKPIGTSCDSEALVSKRSLTLGIDFIEEPCLKPRSILGLHQF